MRLVSRPPFKHSALTISELSLRVRLGVSAEERSLPQEVRVTAVLRFLAPPAATFDDSITNTFCYAEACERLRELAGKREFRLIEKLGADCWEAFRELVGDKAEVGVTIHKVRPPVDGLLGGARFSCGDFLP